jgi:hypothetical protein
MNVLKLGKSGIERLFALALICGLVGALPAVAQGTGSERPNLEEVLIQQTLQNIDRDLAQAQEMRSTSSESQVGLPRVAKEGAPRSATAASTGSARCLPTCNVADGRFLAIASQNLITLSESNLDLQISVPADATSFSIGVFDGDMRGFDASGVSHWDTGFAATYEYSLYADAAANGTGTIPIPLTTGSVSVLSTSMPDNNWIDFSVSTGPDARTPSGNYFYRLNVRLLPTALQTQNAFKIRTSAVLSGMTLDPAARPFAYIANLAGLADLQTVYPSYPATSPTRYDGTFSFYFEVPFSRTELVLWDGDFDRGKFDGTDRDTDDADTPNAPFRPAWFTIDTVPEGVASGLPGTSGNPADDRSPAGNGIYLLKAPSVRYDVIFPGGQSFANENPSGNQEWEQFRISTESFDASLMDHSTSAIPPGVYHLRISGVDMGNLNALVLPYRVLCVDEAGVPCTLLRPYLLGDKVFLDRDGDGNQDAGEQGIAGVVVNLRDSSGVLLSSTTTGADGSYSFSIEKGTYTVEVAAENFTAVGALAGMISTTGGERRTDTVTNDNVLTYDFGFRGTASLGSLVWADGDGDGVQDAGEAGLSGVNVDLLDGNGNVAATTTTSANGIYSFDHLTPGTYSVRVSSATLPAGASPTFDADGTGTANVATVTLAAGQHRTDVNFGYRLLGSIAGRVWNDLDADGTSEAGEAGFNGVTVQLIDTTGAVIATTTTSGNGNYSFTLLPAGVYTVRVVSSALPSGALATGDFDGIATLNVASLSLASGATVSNVNFGYFYSPLSPAPGTGTIGYWKNHSAAWPVQQITLGAVTYTKAQAISLLEQPSRGDKSIDLAKQLIGAKLSVLIGNNPTCIGTTIFQADTWLIANPVGSNVHSSSTAWATGGPIHDRLDDYNNGKLCAPHRN